MKHTIYKKKLSPISPAKDSTVSQFTADDGKLFQYATDDGKAEF